MSIHRHVSFAIFAAILAQATAAFADQIKVTLEPDKILIGTTPAITVVLDKDKLPADPSGIDTVNICGRPITVKPPDADGKFTVQLSNIDCPSPIPIYVMNKNEMIGSAGLTIVAAADSSPSLLPEYRKQSHLLWFYVALIVLLPFGCTVFDIVMSYAERRKVLNRLLPDIASANNTNGDQIKEILTSMDQGPTGLTGLTRGLLTLTLVLVLAIAVFHLIVFEPANVNDTAQKLITALAATLTAITGFYFGSKAASAAQGPSNDAAKSRPPKPTITGAQWTGINQLTITGTGFGAQEGKGSVTVGSQIATVNDPDWTDTKIVATVATAVTAIVNVVVENDSDVSSDPYQVPAPPAPPPNPPGPPPPSPAAPAIANAPWDAAARQLTITGTGFGAQQGTVTINNTPATVAAADWTDTRIVATVPAGVSGPGNLVVTNANGVASAAFQVTIQ